MKSLAYCSLLLSLGAVVYADTQSVVNDGISSAKATKERMKESGIYNPSISTMKTYFGESVVTNGQTTGADLINQTKGKGMSDINQMGTNKSTKCTGSKTQECAGFNLYNDPLTKEKMDLAESSVSKTSNIFSTKFKKDIKVKDYCSAHPTDTFCTECKTNPNNPNCKDSVSCTEISWMLDKAGKQTYACETIQEKHWQCERWVSDIKWHPEIVPPSPPDGSVYQASKTIAYGGFNATLTVKAIIYEERTKLNQIRLTTYLDGTPVHNNSFPSNSHVPFDNWLNYTPYTAATFPIVKYGWCGGASTTGVHKQEYMSIITTHTNTTCDTSNCSMIFNIRLSYDTSSNKGGCPASDKNNSANTTFTLQFPKPKAGSQKDVIDKIVWDTNCPT